MDDCPIPENLLDPFFHSLTLAPCRARASHHVLVMRNGPFRIICHEENTTERNIPHGTPEYDGRTKHNKLVS